MDVMVVIRAILIFGSLIFIVYPRDFREFERFFTVGSLMAVFTFNQIDPRVLTVGIIIGVLSYPVQKRIKENMNLTLTYAATGFWGTVLGMSNNFVVFMASASIGLLVAYIVLNRR